jgi:hypothetical protein
MFTSLAFPTSLEKLQSVLGRVKKTRINFRIPEGQDDSTGFRLAPSENSQSNHASASSRVENNWTTPGDANFNVSSTHIWTSRLMGLNPGEPFQPPRGSWPETRYGQPTLLP